MNATTFETHHLDGTQPLVALRWLDPLFNRSYGFAPKFLHVLFTASESKKDQQTQVLRHTSPQFANSRSDPKEARPGFHEPAKPGGDVSGEAFTTNGAEERQDEKCVCLRCPGICGNRELSGEGQTQQVRRQIRIVRPSNGDS